MIRRIFEAFVKNAGLGGHFTGETMYPRFFAAPLDTHRRADGHWQNSGHNRRRNNPMFWETKRDGTARENFRLHFLARHAFEQTLIMTTLRAKNPIFGLHVAENSDHFFFISEVQMDGRANFSGS